MTGAAGSTGSRHGGQQAVMARGGAPGTAGTGVARGGSTDGAAGAGGPRRHHWHRGHGRPRRHHWHRGHGRPRRHHRRCSTLGSRRHHRRAAGTTGAAGTLGRGGTTGTAGTTGAAGTLGRGRHHRHRRYNCGTAGTSTGAAGTLGRGGTHRRRGHGAGADPNSGAAGTGRARQSDRRGRYGRARPIRPARPARACTTPVLRCRAVRPSASPIVPSPAASRRPLLCASPSNAYLLRPLQHRLPGGQRLRQRRRLLPEPARRHHQGLCRHADSPARSRAASSSAPLSAQCPSTAVQLLPLRADGDLPAPRPWSLSPGPPPFWARMQLTARCWGTRSFRCDAPAHRGFPRCDGAPSHALDAPPRQCPLNSLLRHLPPSSAVTHDSSPGRCWDSSRWAVPTCSCWSRWACRFIAAATRSRWGRAHRLAEASPAELQGCLEELAVVEQGAGKRRLENFHNLLAHYDASEAQRWSESESFWLGQWKATGERCRFGERRTGPFRQELGRTARDLRRAPCSTQAYLHEGAARFRTTTRRPRLDSDARATRQSVEPTHRHRPSPRPLLETPHHDRSNNPTSIPIHSPRSTVRHADRARRAHRRGAPDADAAAPAVPKGPSFAELGLHADVHARRRRDGLLRADAGAGARRCRRSRAGQRPDGAVAHGHRQDSRFGLPIAIGIVEPRHYSRRSGCVRRVSSRCRSAEVGAAGASGHQSRGRLRRGSNGPQIERSRRRPARHRDAGPRARSPAPRNAGREGHSAAFVLDEAGRDAVDGFRARAQRHSQSLATASGRRFYFRRRFLRISSASRETS